MKRVRIGMSGGEFLAIFPVGRTRVIVPDGMQMGRHGMLAFEIEWTDPIYFEFILTRLGFACVIHYAYSNRTEKFKYDLDTGTLQRMPFVFWGGSLIGVGTKFVADFRSDPIACIREFRRKTRCMRQTKVR